MKTHSRLKKFLIAFVSIFVVLLVVVLAALQWPGTWLTPRTLNFAQKQINERFPQFHLEWKNPQVKTETLGLFSDRLLFSFEDFCFTKQDQARACFATLQSGFAYSVPRLQLLEVGPVRAEKGNVFFRQVASEEEKKSSDESFSLPRWLADAILKPVFIEIEKYQIQAADRELNGQVKITSSTESQASGNSFSLNTQVKDSSLGSVEAQARSLTEKVKGPWALRSEANLSLPNNSKLHATASLDPKENAYSYELATDYSSSGPQAHLTASGLYQEGDLSGTLNGRVKAGPVVKIENCQFGLKTKDSDQAHLHTDCPLMMDLDQIRQKNVRMITQTLKRPTFGVRVVSDLQTAFPPQKTEAISGNIDVIPTSNFQSILKTQGKVATRFRVIPSQLPDFEKLDVNVNLMASIPEFQKWVQTFEKTPMAIPAPFHVLSGPVSVKAEGKINEDGGKIQSVVKSELKSEFQSLQTHGKAQIQVQLSKLKPKKVAVQSDVLLSRIQLVLPPVESAPPSQLLPDRRVRHTSLDTVANEVTDKDKKSPLPLTYQVHIHTPPSAPVGLVSSATDEPVKMGVDLTLRDDQPVRGTLDLAPVKYDVAGVKGTTGGLELSVRSSDFQSLATGEVTGDADEKKATVIVAKDPMESLARPQPKLPVPLVELATAIGLKDPLSLAIVDQRQPNAPQTQANATRIPLQVRRRF